MDRDPLQTSVSAGLESFSSATRTWFTNSFEAATVAQKDTWQAVANNDDVLVVAPTGSGKTLAAFLWQIDRLSRAQNEDPKRAGVKVLYVSPLKALGVDVERNLRAPLAGIKEAVRANGQEPPEITVGVRSGDTPAKERRRQQTNPPDILITTPESLYLLLTSKAAASLKTIDTVIIDEIHALAGNKRGAHLALSLERLDEITESPVQRIGLSATVEPAAEVARFLGGVKPVTKVIAPSDRKFEITVEVPVEDMTNPPLPEVKELDASSGNPAHRIGSMWPAIERSIYERVAKATSTIVFTNSRRLAERLTNALNDLHKEALPEQVRNSGEGDHENHQVLARAHHGSVSKEQRQEVEEGLKSGDLRCVVATSSLELGIDMGDVDLVIQVDPPPSVASGLQRLGRSGHQVGAASSAVFYPTHRSRLIEMANLVDRMTKGKIETLKVLANPLDILAQQTIAAAVAKPLDVEEWFKTVRRSAPFQNLPRSAFLATLDLVSGKYPSTEFASLRARVDWDRAANTLTARPGAQRLAVTSGGTIPDRGLYRVVAGSEAEGATRVGELDEEMVHETRVGEVFTLGTTTWRVREITNDSVQVEPAFGRVGKIPFWRGDSPSRPAELGAALGDLTETLLGLSAEDGRALLMALGFDSWAADNALAYLGEQREQVSAVATRRTFVVEKTRDELGDWRFILQSPLGLAVHGPWALAINARLRDEFSVETNAIASNDGIIVAFPDVDMDQNQQPSAADIFIFEPDEIMEVVKREVEGSALFASRFRECAARALTLGGSKPGKRSPLWQQRLRASRLLDVARRYPDFPIILETLRECLQDVYDTHALHAVMADVSASRIKMVEVVTSVPSPYARSLLFGYVGEFLYQGDIPAGERKIAALSVDPQVLRELLGEVPLTELLEPEAIVDVEAELQRTKPGWKVAGKEGVVDLLRSLGPLTEAEIAARVDGEDEFVQDLLADLTVERRIFRTRLSAVQYFAAYEDAGLLSQTVGAAVPQGIPAAYLEPALDPLRDLLVRFVNTHGPFTTTQVATRFGLAMATVQAGLRKLEDDGLVLEGEFLPKDVASATSDDSQWVADTVLTRIRNRSLALLRGSIEPASRQGYAAFLADWQYLEASQRGVDGTLAVLEQLAGLPLPASTWESMVLPARVADYSPRFLDDLVAAGEVTWSGVGSLGSADGWVAFHPAETARFTVRAAADQPPLLPLEAAIVEVIRKRGALFSGAIVEALVKGEGAPVGEGAPDGTGGIDTFISSREVENALWSLVWSGIATSDAISSLRAKISGGKAAQKTARRRPRARVMRRHSLTGLALQGKNAAATSGAAVAGRWSLLPEPDPKDQSTAATLWTAQMLDRYGVVTRGAVASEGFPGGFAQAYRFLADFETAGAARRGYYVQGLGAAQFAPPGAIDQLRRMNEDVAKASIGELARDQRGTVVTLSATDPANPYGSILAWPQLGDPNAPSPKRNAGALVTIAGGDPATYLERGGRNLTTFEKQEDMPPEAEEAWRLAACKSLVAAARKGVLATFTIEKVDGSPISASPWNGALIEAGFEQVPRGLTLRRKVF